MSQLDDNLARLRQNISARMERRLILGRREQPNTVPDEPFSTPPDRTEERETGAQVGLLADDEQIFERPAIPLNTANEYLVEHVEAAETGAFESASSEAPHLSETDSARMHRKPADPELKLFEESSEEDEEIGDSVNPEITNNFIEAERIYKYPKRRRSLLQRLIGIFRRN